MYIQAKKKQRAAEGMVRFIVAHKIIKHLSANNKEANRLKECQLKSMFMCLKISQLVKRRMKKFADPEDGPERMRRQLKHNFTFLFPTKHDWMY